MSFLFVQSLEGFGKDGDVDVFCQFLIMLAEGIQGNSSKIFFQLFFWNNLDGFGKNFTQFVIAVFFGILDGIDVGVKEFDHDVENVVVFGKLSQIFQVIVLVFRAKEDFKEQFCPDDAMNGFFRSHSDGANWEDFLLRRFGLARVTSGLALIRNGILWDDG